MGRQTPKGEKYYRKEITVVGMRTNGLNKPGFNLGLKLEENLYSKKQGETLKQLCKVKREWCITELI